PVLRRLVAERRAVQPRAFATARGPLFAAAEVVDVAECDVAHRLAVGDGDRDAEERDAALRVHRTVDRIDDDDRLPVADATDLFGDDGDVEIAEARDDRVLRRLVDRGRVVAAEALPEHRLAAGPRRQRRENAAHVLRRGTADGEPVSQADTGADRM